MGMSDSDFLDLERSRGLETICISSGFVWAVRLVLWILLPVCFCEILLNSGIDR